MLSSVAHIKRLEQNSDVPSTHPCFNALNKVLHQQLLVQAYSALEHKHIFKHPLRYLKPHDKGGGCSFRVPIFCSCSVWATGACDIRVSLFSTDFLSSSQELFLHRLYVRTLSKSNFLQKHLESFLKLQD